MHMYIVSDNTESSFITNCSKAYTKHQIYLLLLQLCWLSPAWHMSLADESSLKAFIYAQQKDELNTRSTSDKS